MITKEIAVGLKYRQELFHIQAKDSRGNPVKCRVNGKCKTWKRDTSRFRLPVKYGLYRGFYVEPHNAVDWVLSENEVPETVAGMPQNF